MLDHMGFAVKDYDRSKTFYEQALVPLGLSVLKDFPGAAAGFGKDGPPRSGSKRRAAPCRAGSTSPSPPTAARSSTRSTPPLLAAGATEHGAAGVRQIYHPNYYGAYVLDPDGNNVEAVCHKPQ